MAAEVGFMATTREDKGKAELITRDLLGGRPVLDAKDLDLRLGLSSPLHNPVDPSAGKVYLKNLGGPVQDLNLPPPLAATQPATEPTPAESPWARSAGCCYYPPSVCTIEKVKSALERVGREPPRGGGRREPPNVSPSLSSSSVTSSSTKRRGADPEAAVERGDGCDSASGGGGGGLMAAACGACLLYVLIARDDPRCPRCGSHVPAPAALERKRTRVDLNSSTRISF